MNDKPNVIVIVTDDQGLGDVGCNNPLLRTPQLDLLRNESIRLQDFHTEPMCAPTRACLLTGMYSMKAGVWSTLNGRYMLNEDAKTMPEYFHGAGYRTGIFGKWHMGESYPYRPQDRGFDRSVTFGGGVIGETPDYWNNNYFDDVYLRDGQPVRYKGYCTDVWFREALSFISDCRDEPFFCYLPTNAPHDPYHIGKSYYQPYLELGLPERLARFYGMIANIDENIGRLRRHLIRRSILDKTILVFLGDNGSSGVQTNERGFVTQGYNAGLRGRKGHVFEGGHRNNCFIRWNEEALGRPHDTDGLSSVMDLLPTLLSLCKIPHHPGAGFDGMDLSRIIMENRSIPSDRELVIHCMQLDTPQKYKDFCVLKNPYRLVKQDQYLMLFNVREDPGQTNDVSVENPSVVGDYLAIYEKWWERASGLTGDYSYIHIGSQRQREVQLTCHEWHGSNAPAYSQKHVRQGIPASGFWMLEVEQTGVYQFALWRWSPHSGLCLCDMAQEVPGTDQYEPLPVGRKYDILSARIWVQGQTAFKAVAPGDSCAFFQIGLLKGKTKLQTWFHCRDSSLIGAYYVTVQKVS